MIAAHFVDDIERGVQGTEIKAPFLKCAADIEYIQGCASRV
jgi:predicted metal-dependent phosphotriesterase family hydrolase